METLYFGNFTLTDLDKRFGLQQTFGLLALDNWLAMPADLSDYQRESCSHLQKLLRLNNSGWNEQELSLHFIGPLFNLAEISSQQYNLFANRQIGAQIGDYYLTGKPDGMIASGYREPEIPYFAFQEYKKEKDPNGDPAAQALAAMLVGQHLNGDDRPVYGSYVIGQNWYFMALQGKQYGVSPAYSALSDDIIEIIRILLTLKAIVEQYVLQPPSTFVQTPAVA
jgi:hypothetical protein